MMVLLLLLFLGSIQHSGSKPSTSNINMNGVEIETKQSGISHAMANEQNSRTFSDYMRNFDNKMRNLDQNLDNLLSGIPNIHEPFSTTIGGYTYTNLNLRCPAHAQVCRAP